MVYTLNERDLKLSAHKVTGNCFLDDCMMKPVGLTE